jgi:hypothetical protein
MLARRVIGQRAGKFLLRLIATDRRPPSCRRAYQRGDLPKVGHDRCCIIISS